MAEVFPVPAKTWSEACDEHGEVIDETLPNFVYDKDTFDRWKLSLKIAALIAQRPEDTVETQMLAVEVFDSPAPTSDDEQELEEALRGSDRRVARQIKRLSDGTFAPKGLGQILSPKPPESPGTARRPIKTMYDLPPTTLERVRRLGLDEFAKPSATTHEVLGKATTTVEKFAPGAKPGESNSSDYLPERQSLHRQIAEDLLMGKTPQSEQPVAIMMAGGTASGKSSLLGRIPEELRIPPEQHTVHIDPDQIKEQIPEYQELKDRGDFYAAQAVHRESGDIARLVIDQAVSAGLNVIIDGTGNTEDGSFARELTEMDQRGYDVDVNYVDVPVEQATEWSLDRAERDKRAVPIPRVIEIHRSVSRNFESVANLAFLRRLRLYERGVLVAEKNAGEELRILRDDLFRAFLMKAGD